MYSKGNCNVNDREKEKSVLEGEGNLFEYEWIICFRETETLD